MNWKQTLNQLGEYPKELHRLLPPCPEHRMLDVQRHLGKMPRVLVEMLAHFDGAELFLKNGPFVTIFGISPETPLDPFEWAPDWYIDKFTPSWRSGHKVEDEWAVAMTNYGSLTIVDSNGLVRCWDTAQNTWDAKRRPFEEWMEATLREGDAYLKEE